MKRQNLFLLVSVLFFTLACEFIMGTPQPTVSPFLPEIANTGAHHYWMEPSENGCDASADVQVAQYRDKEHFFASDYSTVTYAERTYVRVGEHRYQSINQDNKPLVLIYTENGFALHVYHPGDDPNAVQACLTFSFTLAD